MGSSSKKHKDKDRDRGSDKEKHKKKHRRDKQREDEQHDSVRDVIILDGSEDSNSRGDRESSKRSSKKKRHRSDSDPQLVITVKVDDSSNNRTITDDNGDSHRKSKRHKEKKRHASPPDDPDIKPPKKSKETPSSSRAKPARSPSPPPSSSGGGDSSLSIAETNKLRIKLGLKPLQIDYGSHKKPQESTPQEDAEGNEDIDEETANRIRAERELENETYWKEEKKEFVHAPADNIGKKKEAEKLREKLANHREKRRLEEKLLVTKGLADDSDDDDSAAKWVEKSKRIAEEKALAEKRAKALEELDDAFGVGELVDSEFQKVKNKAYTEKNLKGMKVMHSENRINEGESVIMTLQDKDVLDEETDDLLVNVNMVDDEKYEKNIEDRRMRPELRGYNVFDDLEFDPQNIEKKVLSKYDEEIEGVKKKNFVIGEDTTEAGKKAKMREQMQRANKILESIEAPSLRIASDFLTEEEMTFKKRTKKVRKVRKVLKADDLLNDSLHTSSSSQDLGSRKKSSKNSDASKIKSEPVDMEIDMEIDDIPQAQAIDVSDIKLEDEGDLDFQLALSKARKLKQRQNAAKPSLETLVKSIESEKQQQLSEGKGDTSMVLNATAEFCRTLGDIPSFSGGDLYGDEEMDFETEEAKAYREDLEERGKWNVVEIDETPVDITRDPTELEKAPILEEEPEVGKGIAGALKLAMKKGYLEHEKKKRAAARTMKHLEAKNYTIDDKNYEEDRAQSKREMYTGPTTEFKEKGHYKPEVKLEYTDEDGKPISAKEAFRLLSHKFHGKGSGKNKIDKKRRKADQDKLMQHMSSTDTPLGTLELLQERQKATHSAYIILTGNKGSQQATLSKTSKR